MDNSYIDQIVAQEISKVKCKYAKEKEAINNHLNKKIEHMNEAIQEQKLENKHLLDIIYAKDQELESYKRVESMAISLKKENKRLKAKHNDYE